LTKSKTNRLAPAIAG